jgi:hypothetical protein
VIGDQAIGNGSNSITIGNSSHNATYITGIKGQTTTNGANVHITADGRLMESTTSVTVFDTLYSVGDSLIFITPTPDTFIVQFETVTDQWGGQVVQSDATLDGNGTTESILKLAKQGATDGQVLKWNDALMTWKPADDLDEQDIDGLTFNTGTGDLTVGITNGTNQTIDLDGRYLEAEVDGSTTNELQNLSLAGDSIKITNGTGIDISAYLDNTDTDSILVDSLGTILVKNRGDVIRLIPDTDEQNLSIVSDSLLIDRGSGVDLSVYLDNTDTSGYNSALSLVNDTIYLTDGNGTLGVYVPGDDWGDDVVQTDPTLTGNGTAGDPLSVVFPADQVYDGDSSVTNEIQELIWSAGSNGNDEITLSDGGNTITITDNTGTDDQQIDKFELTGTDLTLAIEDDGQDDQTVSFTGWDTDASDDFSGSWNDLTNVPAGFADNIDNVNDADSSATNELQTLTWSAGTNGNDEITLSVNNSSITITDNVFDGDSSATNEIQQLGWTQDTGLLTLTNSSNVTIDVYDGITRGLVPDSIGVVRPDDYYLNMDGTWKVPVDNDNYVDGFIMTDDNDDDVWQITLGRSPLSDIQETVDLSKYLDNTDTDSIYFRHFNIVSNITRGDTAVVSYVVSDYPDGYVHCDTNDITKIKSVASTTGRIWMDRNLGASRVATSSTDTLAYGDLYQWSRFAEGHQCRNSTTTSTNATTAAPSLGNAWDGKFIIETSLPNDWLTTQNDTLWQGVDGVNNPCPTGYRVPTESELDAERLSWSSYDSAGAFSSPLKLPVSGRRVYNSGGPSNVGLYGYYWSSSVSSVFLARYLNFSNSFASMNSNYRANGFAVRCIKDENVKEYLVSESNSNKLITISEDNEFEYVDKRRPLYTNYTVTEGDTVTVDLRNQPHGIHNVTPTGVFTNEYTLNISNVFTDNTNYASEYTISLFDAGNYVTVNLDSNYTWISQLGNAITSFAIFEDNGFRLELYTIDGNTIYTNINQ